MAREIHILKEIAELLNEGLDMNVLLKEVLSKLLAVTGLKSGWIFLFDEKGEHRLVAHQSLPPALTNQQETIMCKGTCWCVDRYRTGRLRKATNIIECARIETAIKENLGDHRGLTHHATVPLRAGDERFGLLNIGSPGKKVFTESELDLLEAVAFQIGTALKRIMLTKREQENALLAERNRLARDLHDSVNQLLFSLSLTAKGGQALTAEPQIKQTFADIQDLAQEALGEMRSLIWQLRPQGLEQGLMHALMAHARLLGLNGKSKVNGVICLPTNIEENLWRLGQEALSNCKKHANTRDVELEYRQTDRMCSLTIKDHGCGFQYNETVDLPTLGLKSMRERVLSLNGTISICSLRGKGTTIVIDIPLVKEMNE